MFFTIKKPQSQRSFKGFGFDTNSSLIVFIKALGEFIKVLLVYLVKRFQLLLNLIFGLVKYLGDLPKLAKRELVRKLIWSRGRLGRPIATAIILTTSLLVFFVGEFLSGFALVVKSEANTDYLTSSVDMIAKKEITTTEIPDIRKRVESSDYFVQEGDSLYGIGNKFKVSTDALKYVNNLTDDSVLRVGQKIVVPPVSGLIHTVKSGETLSSIASIYQVPSQAIADFNYLLDNKLAIGVELVIPGAKVPQPVAPPVYIAPAISGAGSFGNKASPSKNYCVWPTTVHIVTQNYTWYHNGLDIATPWSGGMPPIFSCTGGTVIRAGWDPWGLGLHVRIDHGNGYTSIYGHMSRLDVRYGQKVSRGQQIGLMGNTGRSSGPHVHFMVEFNGAPQNPFSYTN